MPKIRMKRIADAIIGFEERYNDKIASIFTPIRSDGLVLTKSQVKVLFLLYHRSDQTATELGEATDMTKASLTGILDALEREGLARRQSDSEDRRRQRVSLTAAGAELCDRKARELDARLEERFAALSEEDRALFVEHLAAAARLLDKLED
jgi:DNA-binding MarR family transcriptional regulator